MGVMQSCEQANRIPGSFPVHNEELNSHAGPDRDAEGVNPADASPQDSPGVDNVAAGEDSSTETNGSEQNTDGDTSLLDGAQPALQDDTASLATNNSEQDPAIESTEVSADCIGKFSCLYFYTQSLACKMLGMFCNCQSCRVQETWLFFARFFPICVRSSRGWSAYRSVSLMHAAKV
jgi:hypothetical protein